MNVIKKGTILDVRHDRSGRWVGVAVKDFCPETITNEDGFYPIALAQVQEVEGRNTFWREGDLMPCRASLCKITPREV